MSNLAKNKIIRISLGIVVGIVGLLTSIFAILQLAKVGAPNANIVLQYVIGITLIIVGLSIGLLTIFSNTSLKMASLLSSSLFLGLGIYLLIAHNAFNTIVGLIFPIVLACFGGIYLTKNIVDCVNKSTNTFVVGMIVGAGLLVTGILFAVFHEKLVNVIWLILGLAITTVAIIFIVYTLKQNKPKAKVIDNPSKK